MFRYESTFRPTSKAERLLVEGRILAPDESPPEMIERVVNALVEVETQFSDDAVLAEEYGNRLGSAMDEGYIVMSTPILTNAGRYLDKPLSACTVPVSALSVNHAAMRREVIALHQQGMGTGFSLSESIDPLAELKFLNDVALESSSSGKEDRPVGNMAVISVYHPQILEFINAKVEAPARGDEWKFNISVDIDEQFMNKLEAGDKITLSDGRRIRADKIFDAVCEAAVKCADPGV